MSPHKCSKCDKEFSTLGTLNHHIKTVCSEDKTIFKCTFCSFDTNTKFSLQSHLKNCKKRKAIETKPSVTSEMLKLKSIDELIELINKRDQEIVSLKRDIAYLTNDKDNLIEEKQQLTEKYEKQIDDNLKLTDLLKESQQAINDLKTINSNEIKQINNTLKSSIIKPIVKPQKSKLTKDDKFSNEELNIILKSMPIDERCNTYLQKIKDNDLEEIINKLTPDDYLNGVYSIAKKFIKYFNTRIAFRDSARYNISYKLNDIYIRDTNSISLINYIFNMIKKLKREFIITNKELYNKVEIRANKTLEFDNVYADSYLEFYKFIKNINSDKVSKEMRNNFINIIKSSIFTEQQFIDYIIENKDTLILEPVKIVSKTRAKRKTKESVSHQDSTLNIESKKSTVDSIPVQELILQVPKKEKAIRKSNTTTEPWTPSLDFNSVQIPVLKLPPKKRVQDHSPDFSYTLSPPLK